MPPSTVAPTLALGDPHVYWTAAIALNTSIPLGGGWGHHLVFAVGVCPSGIAVGLGRARSATSWYCHWFACPFPLDQGKGYSRLRRGLTLYMD